MSLMMNHLNCEWIIYGMYVVVRENENSKSFFELYSKYKD